MVDPLLSNAYWFIIPMIGPFCVWMTPPTVPMSILVRWWLSMPLMSTVHQVLNMTLTSVPATPPLAPLSLSDSD
jgi:hypothetical protein